MTKKERALFCGISPSDMAIKGKSGQSRQYSNLIKAIIMRAVKDYDEIKNKLNKCKDEELRDGLLSEIYGIEDFFESKWFKTLTGINGEIYIPSLREGNFRFAELYK